MHLIFPHNRRLLLDTFRNTAPVFLHTSSPPGIQSVHNDDLESLVDLKALSGKPLFEVYEVETVAIRVGL